MPQFLGSWEFIVLALLVLVLFGAKRLPDSARSLGRSMRIFKAETKGLREDDRRDEPSTEQALPPGLPAAPSATTAPVSDAAPRQQPPTTS